MRIELLLIFIILWDGYYFFSYLFSLLRRYRTKKWMPSVSVIIPAYNEAENIERAVRAALEQEYPVLEVIVVDDGSEDDTFERVARINDPRLKVFRKEHEGKAKALNFGIAKARGKIIVTTDADSYMDRKAVEKLVERFYSEDVVAVGGQIRVIPESFLSLAQDVEHLRIAMYRRARELENLSLAPGPLSAFRREALEKIGGIVESTVEDYATTKALKQLGHVVYAPEAKVFTKMPTSLKALWTQRTRWFLGDLRHVSIKDLARLLLGDFITFLDIIVPLLLILEGNFSLLALFLVFEILTILIPLRLEGGNIVEGLLFPIFLWFWAVFYLAVHIYGYVTTLRNKTF
ncbi:glycosyltransferase [Pyrococcus yayanosii]|uniref:Glycosyl transferase, group 2 family protein n=1 Tax=Pyrococcus yayanosii (strain CH1 / JCM 16557) TaxID=529709 RepID=F8AIC0_PYRYC|nr:glycosyltransferase family 2 protein [Pyrococcus yayanosii]AEH25523.1 glycosyl transferase, group 2 family protein [Pyrococcus yayanosii CH1]